MSQSFDQLDPKKHIIIKGAKMHNLKNIDVAIPRNQFTVITGLSGSGKSSLAFDTLYAEGQRRYVESLSAYARQFMGKLDKPEVDYIRGISPAIAIQQKVNTRNPRSTVGTSTEIYDYIKLLFARVGKTYSPISGEEVKSHSVEDVVTFIYSRPEGSKCMICAPLIHRDKTVFEQIKILEQQGFVRLLIEGKPVRIADVEEDTIDENADILILIDRIKVNPNDDDSRSRIGDSVATALYEGEGTCYILSEDSRFEFSNKFELDGMTFERPSVHFFSFNNPVGACRKCEGFGSVIGIDPELVVPNPSLSVYEGAIACWKGEKMGQYRDQLIHTSEHFNFPIHRPFSELDPDQVDLLWKGNKYFTGLNDFFKMVEENSYKIQYRVMLSRYRGKTECPDCSGTRLRKDASYVKINQKSIQQLVKMPVKRLLPWFDQLDSNLSEEQRSIANRLLIEIRNRLNYLSKVGLDYLNLNRLSSTLSGGESQRINLATTLGSSLVGSMYILDEPSIGLHPKDTLKLIDVLQSLKALGNTVIVVEHEEEVMRAADGIIDLGPYAGSHGGELVFQGDHSELLDAGKSLTAGYLTKKLEIPVPERRRSWKNKIVIEGAAENNLKSIDVEVPLNCLVNITGVSGSGKSSLVHRILYPAMLRETGGHGESLGKFTKISGDLSSVKSVEFVDQNPIGKSSRSNPVTYVKAYDEIRSLFSSQQLSKLRGYKPAYFSFNVEGGRCENCKGDGEITVEMQFMADIHLQCDVCHGKRFKEEVLEVDWNGKNISDILDMTIEDAIEFFKSYDDSKGKKIIQKLNPLFEVGLGYVKLGQASSTLSGGEAQRIKLASFLSKGKNHEPTLFIFDEPTTGLHFHDIQKLLHAFDALIEIGHSVVVIEHNTEVIKSADWVIDLGPEGGEEGGTLVFAGTPEELVKEERSYTGQHLKDHLQVT